VRLGQRRLEHVGHPGFGLGRQFLGEVADVARTGDLAAVGRFDAGQDPQQGGLADPVLADEAEALPRRGDQIYTVEHDVIAVGLGDVTRA
jgi:hypothetical protein